MSLVLALLIACADPPHPLPSERAAQPAAEAAPPLDPETKPGVRIEVSTGARWTPENVDHLVPVAPTRQGRTPKPLAASAEIQGAIDTLGKVLDGHARDPKNPWAVAHGILALGPDFALSDGRPGVEATFADWAAEVELGGHSLLEFPAEQAGARVEPHTGLQLKNMAEVGVDPARKVVVAGREHPVADLYRAALVTTWLDLKANEASFRSPDDIGWLVQALATWAPEGELRWRSARGTDMELALLTRFSVAALVKETAFLAEAMRNGTTFERKGQGIFRYTCGGAHLLQGAAYAVARGHGGEQEKAAMKQQALLHLWRFPREQAITDAAIQKAPEHRLKLLSQRLKFAGHALESVQKLEILGFLTPDEGQQAVIADMASSIVKTTTALNEGGAFGKLDEIRAKDEQLYLDLVGDAAHAVRGLELALGRQTLAW